MLNLVDARDDLLELFERITGLSQGDYLVIEDEPGIAQHRIVVDSEQGFYELFFARSLYEDEMSRPALVIRPLTQKWRVVKIEDGEFDDEPIWPNRFDTPEQAHEALEVHLLNVPVITARWLVQAVLPEEGETLVPKGA